MGKSAKVGGLIHKIDLIICAIYTAISNSRSARSGFFNKRIIYQLTNEYQSANDYE